MFKKYVLFSISIIFFGACLVYNSIIAYTEEDIASEIDSWRCANCNTVHQMGYLKEVDNFCDNCGSSSEGCSFLLGRKCMDCSKYGSATMNFCKECGGTLTETSTVIEEMSDYPTESSYRYILICISALLLLYSIGIFILYGRSEIKDRHRMGAKL